MAKQDVIEATVAKLCENFKGIAICNYRNGYVKTEAEEQAVIEDIKNIQSGCGFCGYGFTKAGITNGADSKITSGGLSGFRW